ncbi:hypothetical protein WMW71_10880 [Flavobacterium buctense]|uniref:Uncharacterized protein n=1 Tax=Flavobacterium buctense TaxID=1648146 RepID=A0ABU9E2Z5_9FLAO|nr:hypothetical protein [Flavobacterium buctense]
MHDYLKIIAVAIGFWYARKYGREAVEKINKFNAEKEKQNKKS